MSLREGCLLGGISIYEIAPNGSCCGNVTLRGHVLHFDAFLPIITVMIRMIIVFMVVTIPITTVLVIIIIMAVIISLCVLTIISIPFVWL